jgi:CHAD domain
VAAADGPSARAQFFPRRGPGVARPRLLLLPAELGPLLWALTAGRIEVLGRPWQPWWPRGDRYGLPAAYSEALHQIRIGLRRLRAAISFFSDIVAGLQTEFIKAELKWVTQALSPGRDLDVYISEVLTPFREQRKDNADFRSLYRDFERRRAEAFGRAVDAVGSDRYRDLLIELAAWIEAGAWSHANGQDARASHERPIEIHATEQLARRRKKTVKKARLSIGSMPPSAISWAGSVGGLGQRLAGFVFEQDQSGTDDSGLPPYRP